MGSAMFLYCLTGFLAGMVAGALLNRFLLRNIPAEQWRTDHDLKMKYGGLNWLIAILGAVIAYFVARYSV